MMNDNTMYGSGMAIAVGFLLAMGCGGDDLAKKGQQDPVMAQDAGTDSESEDTGGAADASPSDMGEPVSDASTPLDQGGEPDGAMVDMANDPPDMAEDTGPMVCDLAFESTLRPALHIIADYSGSMSVGISGGTQKYQMQNSSLTALAGRMTSQFHVGFVSFPEGNTCDTAIQVHLPMGEWDASDITSNLIQSPTGGSPSAKALRDVGESMRFSNPNDPDVAMRERHVLIFADSEGNSCLDDGDDIMSAQQMAAATGATLHAIAFEASSNSFSEDAALQTGGTHSLISQESELTPAIEAALSSMEPCTLTLTSAPVDPSTFKLFEAGVEVDPADYVRSGLDVTLSDDACSTVSFEDLTATTSC